MERVARIGNPETARHAPASPARPRCGCDGARAGGDAERLRGLHDETVRTGLFLPTTDSALVAAVIADMAAAPPEVAIPALESLWAWGLDRFGTAIDSLGVPLRVI